LFLSSTSQESIHKNNPLTVSQLGTKQQWTSAQNNNGRGRGADGQIHAFKKVWPQQQQRSAAGSAGESSPKPCSAAFCCSSLLFLLIFPLSSLSFHFRSSAIATVVVVCHRHCRCCVPSPLLGVSSWATEKKVKNANQPLRSLGQRQPKDPSAAFCSKNPPLGTLGWHPKLGTPVSLCLATFCSADHFVDYALMFQ
jgi:hypothetical protein